MRHRPRLRPRRLIVAGLGLVLAFGLAVVSTDVYTRHYRFVLRAYFANEGLAAGVEVRREVTSVSSTSTAPASFLSSQIQHPNSKRLICRRKPEYLQANQLV